MILHNYVYSAAFQSQMQRQLFAMCRTKVMEYRSLRLSMGVAYCLRNKCAESAFFAHFEHVFDIEITLRETH